MKLENDGRYVIVAFHGITHSADNVANPEEYGGLVKKAQEEGADLWIPELTGHGRHTKKRIILSYQTKETKEFLMHVYNAENSGEIISAGFSYGGQVLLSLLGDDEFREKVPIKKIGLFYTSPFVGRSTSRFLAEKFVGGNGNSDGSLIHKGDDGRYYMHIKNAEVPFPEVIFDISHLLATGNILLPKKADLRGIEIFYAYGGKDRIMKPDEVKYAINALRNMGATVHDNYYKNASHGFPEEGVMGKAIDDFLGFALS
ncbi:MAG: alpha/beta hydrolase [Candidatus Micrarchaeota archaeon]|nr:alpha/beta hydrolase [Candidatus Micrarchaeota archaeon]